MNWKNIWELTKINILYSNPQALAKIRQKQAKKTHQKPKQAYKKILFQQAGLILLYSFIFLYLFTGVDYRTYPGYFSFQLFIFFLMSIISAFSTMFAVFYNSKDSKLYLPLPVRQEEIFTAKLLASVGLNLTFLIPTLSLLLITYQQLMDKTLLAIGAALLQFLILMVASITLSVILVFLLGQLLMKSRYKNLISTGLMLLSSIGAVGLILYLQNNQFANQVKEVELMDMSSIPLISGFYDIIRTPLSPSYWLFIGIFLLLLILLYRVIIPRYYQQLSRIDERTIRTRTFTAKNSSLSSTLIRHHLGTLKDPTLWMISILSTFMVAMFFLPQLMTGNDWYRSIPTEYVGLVFLIGLTLGYLTSGSFTMVGMSLERENYSFIKSLPLDFYQFLRQKFLLLWGLQTLVPFLAFSLIGIFAQLPLPHLVALVGGLLLASYPSSLASYKKDYKYLSLHWQNISQLFTRGGGQLWAVLLFFLAIILAAGVMIAGLFLSRLIGAWLVSLAIIASALLIVFLLHLHFEKHFWSQWK